MGYLDGKYNESRLDVNRIRSFAQKVAKQTTSTALPFLPATVETDPVWVIAAAPAEATRSSYMTDDGVLSLMSHEGILLALRPNGELVADSYSYDGPWEIDPARIRPLNRDKFNFRPMSLTYYMHLDYGRDRWRDVPVKYNGHRGEYSRDELVSSRPIIVHARGVGLSRALKQLYLDAGGEDSPRPNGARG